MSLEEIYQKLPIPLQQLAVNVEGWRTVRKNYGGKFREFLREAESRTFWTREQITAYRDKRLQAFVRHCYETVPYYRKLFRNLKIVPEDIRTLEDLSHLPVLTKQDVQDNSSELISEAVPPRERILIKTSGTTGGAIHFYTTKQAIQEQWAVWWRYRRCHGIQIDAECGYFKGRSIVLQSQNDPPFWRYNYPGKRILYSAYHMTPTNFSTSINELRHRRSLRIHMYHSLIALSASHIIGTGADLCYQF